MQLGIIGCPLGHSQSPDYFARKFAAMQLDGSTYERFELTSIEELPAMLEAHPLLNGFNVTLPYKQEVMPYLDEIDAEALAIGAVNTVKVTYQHGRRHLKGFNTDVVGFERSLRQAIRTLPRKALVLGTGGASKAVVFTLEKMGVEYQYVSRRESDQTLSYQQLTEALVAECTLIVNTTPLGMSPRTEEAPALPYHMVGSTHLLYDLIYNPAETRFLRLGKEQGAATENGMAMFVGQAEAAYEIWNM